MPCCRNTSRQWALPPCGCSVSAVGSLFMDSLFLPCRCCNRSMHSARNRNDSEQLPSSAGEEVLDSSPFLQELFLAEPHPLPERLIRFQTADHLNLATAYRHRERIDEPVPDSIVAV